MGRPGDEIASGAGGHGHVRVSHADREQVIDALKVAFGQGRLTNDELDARAGLALVARTHAELAAVTADIPAGPDLAQPPRPARAQPHQPGNRAAKWAVEAGVTEAVEVRCGYEQFVPPQAPPGMYFDPASELFLPQGVRLVSCLRLPCSSRPLSTTRRYLIEPSFRPARAHAGPHRWSTQVKPSSRVRQLGAAAVGSLGLRRPAPRIASSRLRPGHVIGFAGGPHPPPAQLGLASRYRPPLPPGTAAERPPGYQDFWGLPDRGPPCDDSHKSGPSFRAAVRNCGRKSAA